MDRDVYKSFVTVAETRSFSEAARALYCTQSAISRRVARLEAEFGSPLFERYGRHVECTAFGERMLPVARAIVARMDEAISLAREQKRVAPSRLRFGAGGSVMALLLLPVLASFLAAHPRKNIDLVDADDVSLEEGVVSGELDCAVMTHWGSTRTATHCLLTEEILLLIPNDHQFAALAAVPVKLLANETVLLPSARMNAGNLEAHALRRAGIESTPYRVDHAELKRSLVRAGFGVALLPKLLVPLETIPGLAAVPLDPPIFRELHLIWPLDRTVPPLARLLMVNIRASFANRQGTRRL